MRKDIYSFNPKCPFDACLFSCTASIKTLPPPTTGNDKRERERSVITSPTTLNTAYHLCEGIKWSHINAACISVLCKHAENRELGTDGFATASRRTNEHIVITVVNSVEHCTRNTAQQTHNA